MYWHNCINHRSINCYSLQRLTNHNCFITEQRPLFTNPLKLDPRGFSLGDCFLFDIYTIPTIHFICLFNNIVYISRYSLFLFFFFFKTWVIRDYPAELMFALLRCTFVTILSTIIALIAEKDPNAWKLNFNMELICIVYSVSKNKTSFILGFAIMSLINNLPYGLISRHCLQLQFEPVFIFGHVARRGLSTLPCLSHLV